MRQIDLIKATMIEDESTRFKEQVEKTGQALAENLRRSPHSNRESTQFEKAAQNTLSEHPAMFESLGPQERDSQDAFEAIILEKMRPAWLIKNDNIVIKGEFDRTDLVQANLETLQRSALSVGRVDLIHHADYGFVGTGWMIDKDIAVTNRHVAELFAAPKWPQGWKFPKGAFNQTVEARLDFVKQLDSDEMPRRRVEVLEILYVAGEREPDIAFLRVDNRDNIEPIELITRPLRDKTPVAAIGYPAFDDRNDIDLMNQLFGHTYNIKRFSPGFASPSTDDNSLILGDYTSLGGSSGSAIISLESGKVQGLHFAGKFKQANYAVAADIVASAKRRLRTFVSLENVPSDPVSDPEKFEGRKGYDETFLGEGDFAAPLPGWGNWEEDLAPVSDDDGCVLKYLHFSVVQSQSRRLPLITAVNIDGEKAFKLKRKDKWMLDGRIDKRHQIGNALYVRNRLDRGHLVRRLDPGWGESSAEAQMAELDTFHYTNSAPQHENLNRRDWVGLEDYVLGSARTEGFKASVFTGPVFRRTDKVLKSQPGASGIQIPEEFWKIAVMVNADTGKLSATGYVLTQGEMIRDMTEAAFILGAYKVYQVKISMIEKATGLDFGTLKDSDPLNSAAESIFGDAAFEISRAEDLRL